jgi:hypothetical protein
MNGVIAITMPEEKVKLKNLFGEYIARFLILS